VRVNDWRLQYRDVKERCKRPTGVGLCCVNTSSSTYHLLQKTLTGGLFSQAFSRRASKENIKILGGKRGNRRRIWRLGEQERDRCVEWVDACWRLEYGTSRENGVDSFSLDLKDNLLSSAVRKPGVTRDTQSNHSNVNKISENERVRPFCESLIKLDSIMKLENPAPVAVKTEMEVDIGEGVGDKKTFNEIENRSENTERTESGRMLDTDDNMDNAGKDNTKIIFEEKTSNLSSGENPCENIDGADDVLVRSDKMGSDHGEEERTSVEKRQKESEKPDGRIKNGKGSNIDSSNEDEIPFVESGNSLENDNGSDGFVPDDNDKKSPLNETRGKTYDASDLWARFSVLRHENTFLTMSSLGVKPLSNPTDFRLVSNPEKYERPLSRVLLANWREDEFTPLEAFAPYVAFDKEDEGEGDDNAIT